MNYQNTYSWKMTLGIMPLVVRLAEELPAAEEQGLKHHLFALQVDLPSAVGLDLASGGERRREQLMRLQSAVSVVEMIYPAIDAGELTEAMKALEARLMGDAFSEEEPAPEAAEEAVEEPDEQPEVPAPAAGAINIQVSGDTAGDV